MLVESSRSILLLIDVQRKLLPSIDQGARCLDHCAVLLAAARRLQVPVLATEHFPASIGPTVDTLRDRLRPEEIIEKSHFDGTAEPDFCERLHTHDRPMVVVAGTEAHVCVLQTVLGLKSKGFEPVVVADATSSRLASSRDLAISRMRHRGIDIVSTEMVLFEWLRAGGTAEFKDLLPLIKAGKIDDQ